MTEQSLPHLLSAFFVLCVVWAAAKALVAVGQIPPPPGRYATLDGLRGVLASMVFVHHGWLWYDLTHYQRWQTPVSNIAHFLGAGSVQMFFMITAFLFFGKLIDKEREIDWGEIYISRIMRLAPLYLFAMLIMFMLVGQATKWVLHTTSLQLAGNVLQWALFTIAGAPDINGLADTSRIIAGVTWTLPMEWFFYWLLPGMALLVGRRVPVVWLAPLGLAMIWFVVRKNVVWLSAPFLGGMIAATVVRQQWLKKIASRRIVTVLALAGVIYTAIHYSTPFDMLALIILTLVFCVIACGNSFNGFLLMPSIRLVGAMGYGIYLLHGLLLYAVFGVALPRDLVARFDVMTHWGVVASIGCVLVVIGFLSFKWIEMPAINRSHAVRDWMRQCRHLKNRLR